MAYGQLWGLLAALMFAAALAPPHARADDNAEARVFFEQGNRALARAMTLRGPRRSRALEEALDAYVRSLGIVRSRNVVYNAGVTLEHLGRHAEAFAYIAEYLRNEDLEASERGEAEAKLTALRERVAVVAVGSTPPGAEVRIDRRDLAPIGRTPMEIAVGEGEHTIHFALAGHTDTSVRVEGRIGARVDANATLDPRPVTLTVHAPGALPLTVNGTPVRPDVPFEVLPGRHVIRYGSDLVHRVDVHPGQEPTTIDLAMPDMPGGGEPAMLALRTNVASATISIDGRLVEPGEDGRAEVPSGRHTVRIEAPGRVPAVQQLDIPEGGEVTVEASLEPEIDAGSSTLGAWPAAMWALSGVVGLGAIGTALGAFNAHAVFDNEPTTENADSVDTWNVIADALGIGAVVLAATAFVLTLANGDVEQTPSTLRIAAAPQPGGAIVVADLALGGAR